MRFQDVIRAAAICTCLGTVTTSQAQEAEVPAHAAETAAEPAAKIPATDDIKAKGPSEAATFTPPFPQRDELIQPPNHKGLTKAQRDEVRTEVILKGFVNVDGTKALLSVNGKVAAMAVGDSQFGIEVVSIAPPQVTLQRGRVRWTEALYATH